MVDARDILPDHIKHYQKDMGPPEASTFRHSAMYITALELVHIGDSNPDAFECVMSGLSELKAKAMLLDDITDGKSMLEKSKEIVSASAAVSGSADSRKSRLSTKKNSTSGKSLKIVSDNSAVASCVQGNVNTSAPDDLQDVSSAPVIAEELLAPERRLKRGHPTTSRDKAPYESTSKRSRFCSICRGKGHKSTTCPNRGDMPVKPRKEGQCSNCGLTGQRKTSCSKPLFSNIPEIHTMTG